jgi:hypothetical protein
MSEYWNAMSKHGWCEPVSKSETPPGFLDENERASAMARIDAIVARKVFAMSEDELKSVLDSFVVLRRREERVFGAGEYKTKNRVIESYRRIDPTLKLSDAG